MRKLFLLSLFLILLVVPLVSAPPPFQQTTILDKGIELESPIKETIEANESFEFHIHAHNASNGLLLRNDTIDYCTLHLYTPNSGKHIFEGNMSFRSTNSIDFFVNMSGGNFSELGQYAVLYYCEVTGEIGGFLEHPFFVTPTGSSSAFGLQIFLFIFLFGLIIFGFFIKNEWIVILGGMGLIALGIFSLTQGISDFRNDLTQMVSLVTIGIGAIVSIVTSLQVINDEL